MLACGLSAMLLLAAQVPAGASEVSEGSLTFAGTAVIPTFPCAAPAPGEFLCVGSFTASTAGSLRGLYGSASWDVSLESVTNGQFSYADNISPGVPCSEGTARGSTSLNTQASGQAFGTYQAGTELLAVRDVAISYSFVWTRVGATAILGVTDVAITLQVDGLGSVPVVTDGTARAMATFVPSPSSPPPTGCAGGTPTELRGSILGDVSGVAATP